MNKDTLNNLKNPCLRRKEGENYELKVFKKIQDLYKPKGIWSTRRKFDIPKDLQEMLDKLKRNANYAVDIYFLDEYGYHPVQVKISGNEHRPDLTAFLEFVYNPKIKDLINPPYYIYYEGKCNLRNFFRDHENIKVLSKEDLGLDSLEDEFNQLTLTDNITISKEQIDKVQEILNMLIKESRCLFNAPTGYGKTLICLCVFNSLYQYNLVKRVLILVPSLIILEQTKKVYRKYGYELKESINDSNHPFQISTYHYSHNLVNENYDMIIFDESHRTAGIDDSSEKNWKVILKNESRFKLFVTATLRCGDKDLKLDKDIIFNDMSDSKIYGNIVKVSYKEALEQKRICEFRLICFKYAVSDIEDPVRDPDNAEDIKKIKLLEKCVYKENINEGYCDRIICFCNNKDEIDKVMNIYKNMYLDTKLLKITEDIKKEERKNILEDFDNSYSVILFSIRVLAEGYDTKKCDGVFLYDYSENNSYVTLIQKIGRASRYLPGKVAKIIVPILGEDLEYKTKLNNIWSILTLELEDEELLKDYLRVDGYSEKFEKLKSKNEDLEEIEEIENELEIIKTDIKELVLSKGDISSYIRGKIKKLGIKIRSEEEYKQVYALYNLMSYEELKNRNVDWFYLLGINAIGFNGGGYYTFDELRNIIKEYIKNNSYYGTYEEMQEIYNILYRKDNMVPYYYKELYNKDISLLFKDLEKTEF